MPGANEIKNFDKIKNIRNLYIGPAKFMIDEKYDFKWVHRI